MKYTIEQKQRTRGMNSFFEFKEKIGIEFKMNPASFTIKGDFIVIESEMNERFNKRRKR